MQLDLAAKRLPAANAAANLAYGEAPYEHKRLHNAPHNRRTISASAIRKVAHVALIAAAPLPLLIGWRSVNSRLPNFAHASMANSG